MATLTLQDHRRNTVLLSGVEGLWGFGMALVSSNQIIPSFVHSLGGGPFLVGLVPALWSAGVSFGQFFSGPLAAGRDRRKSLVFWLHVAVLLPYLLTGLWFLPGGASLAGGGILPPLAAFFLFYTVASLGIGLTIPIWANFMAQTTLPSRRGTSFGFIFFAQTVTGVGGAALASRLLRGDLPAPAGYAYCFLGMVAAAFLGNFFFLPVRERSSGIPPGRSSLRPGDSLAILREDAPFRRYLTARLLVVIFPLAVAFYTVEAQRTLGVGGREAGLFTAVFLAAQSLGNLVFGHLGDRIGHRKTQAIGNVLLLAGIALLLLPPSLPVYFAASALFGCFFATEFNTHFNLVMNFCPREDKTAYLALAGLFLAPARIAVPLAGGALIGVWGARPVWAGLLVLVLLGTALLLRIPEPAAGERRA